MQYLRTPLLLILSAALLLPSFIAYAKIPVERLKGFDVINDKSFELQIGSGTTASKQTIDLGVLNPVLGIPFYSLIQNYMDLPPIAPQDAVVRNGIYSLFRPFDPSNPVPIEPSILDHSLSSHMSPAMLGTFLAEYLLQNENYSLKVSETVSESVVQKRKEELAIKFFINHKDFRTSLTPLKVAFCNEPQKKQLVFNVDSSNELCKSTDINTVPGDVLWSALSDIFKTNIYSTVSIFSTAEPDLMALRYLQTWLWLKTTSKEGFWDYYEAIETRLKDYGVKFLPNEKQAWLDAAWPTSELKNLKYPEIKSTTAVKLDDKAFSQYIAKLLSGPKPRQLKISPTQIEPQGGWPDCCGASLRTFIIFNFIDPNSTSQFNPSYDIQKLEDIGASEKVIRFFTEYGTRELQGLEKASYAWAEIQAGISGVTYKTGSDGKATGEISAGSKNIFTALVQLLFENADVKPKSWDELAKAIDPNATVEEHLDEDGFGSVDFSMLGEKFYYSMFQNHFSVEYFPIHMIQSNADRPEITWQRLYENSNAFAEAAANPHAINESQNLKWLELGAMASKIERFSQKVASQLNTTPHLLYFIDFHSELELKETINGLNAQNLKLLNFILSRAVEFDNVISDTAIFAIKNGDKSKYSIISRYVSKLDIRMDTRQKIKLPDVLNEKFTSDWFLYLDAIADNAGNNKYLHTIYISTKSPAQNFYMTEEVKNNLNKTKIFMRKLFKNLNKNKSLTRIYTNNFKMIDRSDVDFDQKVLDNMILYFSENKYISSFTLTTSGIVDKDAARLLKAAGQSSIVYLYIDEKNISDISIKALADGETSNPTLEVLTITNNDSFSEDGFAYLDEKAFKNSKVIRELNYTNLGNMGPGLLRVLENRYRESPTIDKIDFTGTIDYFDIPKLPENIDSELAGNGALERQRSLWSPFATYFRYLGNYTQFRQYRTLAFRGNMNFTRPRMLPTGTQPNVTYGRPLFIYTQNRQFVNAMPNSLLRLQPAQPIVFTQNQLVPWSAQYLPSKWTGSNWRSFVSKITFGLKQVK